MTQTQLKWKRFVLVCCVVVNDVVCCVVVNDVVCCVVVSDVVCYVVVSDAVCCVVVNDVVCRSKKIFWHPKNFIVSNGLKKKLIE